MVVNAKRGARDKKGKKGKYEAGTAKKEGLRLKGIKAGAELAALRWKKAASIDACAGSVPRTTGAS